MDSNNIKHNGRYKKLLSYTKPYVLYIFIGIISILIGMALKISLVYIIQKLIDSIIIGWNSSEFYKYLHLAFFILIGQGVFQFTENISISKYSTNLNRDLRRDFSKQVLRSDLPSIKEYDSGDLVSRINNDISRLIGIVKLIPNTICQPILFILAFIYGISINIKLFLACTVIIPILSLLFNKISKSAKKYGKELTENMSEANSLFKDMIDGIYVLKSYNLRRILSKKYKEKLIKSEGNQLELYKISALLGICNNIIWIIPYIICPIYGGYLVINGEITPGQLIAFTNLIEYFVVPIERILGFKATYDQGRSSIDRVFEILDKDIELLGDEEFKRKESLDAIIFKEVSFSYDNSSEVFDNVSFEIPEKKIVGIVGPSGSGKSTIVNILCGFYGSNTGHIEIFGNEIKNSNLKSIRSQISLVTQDTYLFPTTVFENILYGRLDATEAEVIKAAKLANAHDFIMELPKGYDTILNEEGKNLSGGQRQRIALARAVLKDSPILLLDEPTSALDLESEMTFMDALKSISKDKTILIISHRLSIVKDLDEIIVINEGAICEQGTHNDLMKNKGLYHQLYTTQIEDNRKIERILQGGSEYC